MKNKLLLYIGIIVLCLTFIIVSKFVLIAEYGWLETVLFIVCILILIFSIIKLYQLLELTKVTKITLEIVTILFIIWFSLLSIDYKRHKNLYAPLFSIGYKVIQDYDMNIQNGNIYKNKSTFYLFGIKIDEVYVIED